MRFNLRLFTTDDPVRYQHPNEMWPTGSRIAEFVCGGGDEQGCPRRPVPLEAPPASRFQHRPGNRCVVREIESRRPRHGRHAGIRPLQGRRPAWPFARAPRRGFPIRPRDAVARRCQRQLSQRLAPLEGPKVSARSGACPPRNAPRACASGVRHTCSLSIRPDGLAPHVDALPEKLQTPPNGGFVGS